MEDIAIFNSNSYRIGDIIGGNILEIERDIMNNPKYIGTFIYNFIRQVQNRKAIHKNERINIASEIIRYMLQLYKFEFASSDTLVIHLRLGDILNVKEGFLEKEEYQKTIVNRLPAINYLLSNINKYDKENIVIVTAFHHNLYGKDPNDPTKRYIISQNNDYSKELLDNFMKQIPKKYNVSIRSNMDIDKDFLYLCSAPNLLLSSKGSGFGNCAQTINQIIKTGKYLPVRPIKRARNPTLCMKLV